MKLMLGNCLQSLKELSDNSIDSIVTDPPYGLSFMGKKWDYDVPSKEIWIEALRVLKPGGHLLSFGGTRTYHRMVVNIEDAGFEIRDQIQWIYGQGFPKSTNVLKSGIKQGLFCGCKENTKSQVSFMRDSGLSETISSEETSEDSLQSLVSKQDLCSSSDGTQSSKGLQARKECGLEGRNNLQKKQRELRRTEICEMPNRVSSDGPQRPLHNGAQASNGKASKQDVDQNRSSSSQRPQHKKQSNRKSGTISGQSSAQTCGSCGKEICDSGYGTALKPANEPIVVARKPLDGTVANNITKWGCGALNIDGTRVGAESIESGRSGQTGFCTPKPSTNKSFVQGRWPANVIFDEEAGAMLDEQSGFTSSTAAIRRNKSGMGIHDAEKTTFGKGDIFGGFNDSGGASRFFYCAKSSKSERNADLDGMPGKLNDFQRESSGLSSTTINGVRQKGNCGQPNQNHHPTVKPIKLMEYLCKLVTPPNGTVLDPFMGSGSTGVAAKNLDFKFVGIEMNSDYFSIAQKRISSASASSSQVLKPNLHEPLPLHDSFDTMSADLEDHGS